jgi:hypothetical protein
MSFGASKKNVPEAFFPYRRKRKGKSRDNTRNKKQNNKKNDDPCTEEDIQDDSFNKLYQNSTVHTSEME